MIRRVGNRYQHVHEGRVLGTHKRKADAEVNDNAHRLVMDAVRRGITKLKLKEQS